MEQNNKALSTIEKDLYFLIVKFLEAGPCRETAKALRRELGNHGILPKRVDWEGEEHEQDFDELDRKLTHIGPSHLLDVCARVGSLLAKDFPPTVPNINSLLGAGRQSLLRTDKDVKRQYYTVREYAARLHQQPLYDSVHFTKHHNLVKALHGREVSGPMGRRHIAGSKLYQKLQLYCRTLGHLSAVYCVLFDRSGRYVITGADDFLVKIWGAYDGRLIATLRGASAEITDIAINNENTLIAAGSLDRLLRVWCMQYCNPIAVLSAHSGVITSVNFCPYQHGDKRYLVTTSADGSVAFWDYVQQSGGQQGKQVKFSARPLQYNERMRPGQAQMICASFSAGGMFMAAGSADHYVRVYMMEGDEGPHRILETEAHGDRVDSVCWAHNELRFISGSKDGSADIWHYERQQWKSQKLLMTQKLPGEKETEEDSKLRLKVIMVSWDLSDRYVVTAVNDYTIKIWNSDTGVLTRVLRGHKDEMFVLECHPLDDHVLLSVGHDGMLFVWDILTGEILTSYQNSVEGQDSPAIFDAKWSPDGTMVAATDGHGHMMLFGLGSGSDKFKELPPEMYFHTDYRPLVRDADHFVLDEQTQLAPHLMPPPFLVDMDGSPYPPRIQRLVPGRELCHIDQLVPNIALSAQNRIEVNGASPGNEPRSNIDQMIAALAQRQHSAGEGSPQNAVSPRQANNQNIPGVVEGVRHSTGNWQRENDVRWSKRLVVRPLPKSVLRANRQKNGQLAQWELEQYKREQRRRPVMITVTAPANRNKGTKARTGTATRNGINGTRSRRTQGGRDSDFEDHDDLELDGRSSVDSFAVADESARAEDDMLSSASSSDDSSSDYSDWIADHGAILEPPKRSRRKPVRRRACANRTDTDTDESDEPDLAPDSDDEKPKKPPKPKPKPKKKAPPAEASAEFSEAFRPSEWLAQTVPRKSPYYPQMGDEVMFFKEGYQEYLKNVRAKQVYDPGDKAEPYEKLNLKEPQLVKVVAMKYEIRPPRLCCLKLGVLKPDGSMTKDFFSIKYHDMNDVLDFFVLLQTYQIALNRDWKEGDLFRSMINDDWWTGRIEEKADRPSPFQSLRVRWDNGEIEWMSPWDLEPQDGNRLPADVGGAVPVMPEEITAILYHPRDEEWPQGGREVATARILAGLEQVMELSVAEYFLAPVDLQQYPSYAKTIEYPIDLSLIKERFQNRFYRRITTAKFDARYLATNAEKFNEPHSSIVKSARIVTELCLRIMSSADPLDITAEYHRILDEYHSSDSDGMNIDVDIDEPGPSGVNSRSPGLSRTLPSTAGVRTLNARTRINEPGPSGVQVKSTRQDPGPSGSRTNKIGTSRRSDENLLLTWTQRCQQLLQLLWQCEDSGPFREPVDLEEHPDYLRTVKLPMDMSTVREYLEQKKYNTPIEFCKDMRLIFSNSRNYNTNKRSRIYSMTVRLSATFEDQMRDIMQSWKAAKRREAHAAMLNERLASAGRGTRMGKRRYNEDTDSDEDGDDANENNDEEDDDVDFSETENSRGSAKPAGTVKRNGIVNGIATRGLPTRATRTARDSDDESASDEDDAGSERCFAPGRSARPVRAAARKRKRGGGSEDSYRPGSRRRPNAGTRRSAASSSRNPTDSDDSDIISSRRKKKRLNYGELSDDSSTRPEARTSSRKRVDPQTLPVRHKVEVGANQDEDDEDEEDVEEEEDAEEDEVVSPVRTNSANVAGPSRTAVSEESESDSSSSSDNEDNEDEEDNESEPSGSESEEDVDLNAPPPKANRTTRSAKPEPCEEEEDEEEQEDEDEEEEEDEDEDEEEEEASNEDVSKRPSRTKRLKYAEVSSAEESDEPHPWAKAVKRQMNGSARRRTTKRTPKPRARVSDLDGDGGRTPARRRRRGTAPNYAEDSEEELRLPKLMTVSSRGRVRKVTEKVRALLKN